MKYSFGSTRASLEALSGLELTGLRPDMRAILETNLVAVDQILRSYELEADEDYEQMEDTDLQTILEILNRLVTQVFGQPCPGKANG